MPIQNTIGTPIESIGQEGNFLKSQGGIWVPRNILAADISDSTAYGRSLLAQSSKESLEAELEITPNRLIYSNVANATYTSVGSNQELGRFTLPGGMVEPSGFLEIYLGLNTIGTGSKNTTLTLGGVAVINVTTSMNNSSIAITRRVFNRGDTSAVTQNATLSSGSNVVTASSPLNFFNLNWQSDITMVLSVNISTAGSGFGFGYVSMSYVNL
jgi:hypothetical protein